MIVILNDTLVELPEGAVLSDVLRRLGLADDRRGIALALDGDVVLRTDWPRTSIAAGQRVEVLEARAGG